MIQLLFHLWGDFIVQTDAWALNKKKPGWFGARCCLTHCVTYSAPFLFIGSLQAVSVIFITHFIIDRTRIIDYLLAWKNGVYKIVHRHEYDRIYEEKVLDISNFGFGRHRPFAISIWLYITADNIAHTTINFLALKYL